MILRKIIILASLTSLSAIAFENSDCEKLAKAWNAGSTKIKEEVIYDFDNLDQAACEQLPDVPTAQLVLSANHYATNIMKFKPVPGVAEIGAFVAKEYLATHSSNSEGSIKTLTLGKISVDYIEHFPGDNQYGYIFESNTANMIADVQDGEFTCF